MDRGGDGRTDWVLVALFVAIMALLALCDDTAQAQQAEETIRRTAQEEGIDPDLAAAVARCESGFRPDARNGQYEGPFQMSPGWGSSEQRQDPEWATRRFADSVRAGSASRHWRACWPGRGRASSHARGRSVRASAPPTGTDRCDRASGSWRCHPSWTLPDALSVSPTIETDPGPHIEACSWVEGAWTCRLSPLASVGAVAVELSATALPVAEVRKPALSWLDVLFSVLAVAVVGLLVLTTSRRQ